MPARGRHPLTVAVRDVGWAHPDGAALREAQRVEIAAAYGRDDSEAAGSAAGADDMAAFFVAYGSGSAVACGGLRLLEPGVAEIKRMYAAPAVRRTGAAVAVLRAIESWAGAHGVSELRLETGDRLLAAQRFYQREGYQPIAAYGPYVGSSLSRCYSRLL